jgi:hypothetical protein
MMPIKPRRRLVLRIDQERKHRGIGADRTRNGVKTPADVCSSR